MTRVYLRQAFFGLVSLSFLAAAGFAEDRPLIPPDALVFCTVCHGVQMKGNPNIEAPRLSGMDRDYVERQLYAFRKGWRGRHENDLAGMEMRPMAEILSDEQIAAAADYVSAVKSEVPPITLEGDAEQGKKAYVTCAACHGGNAEGVPSLGAPALAGLNDWYLFTQLENFRDGTRGSHPDDVYGAQMRAASAILSGDTAVRDVVAYIMSLESR